MQKRLTVEFDEETRRLSFRGALEVVIDVDLGVGNCNNHVDMRFLARIRHY